MNYYTVAQFAKILGVSRWSIYKRIKSGEIKTDKPGHGHLIKAKEVERWKSKKKKIYTNLEKVFIK